MLNDWHLHTSFSSDSDEPVEHLPAAAAKQGMESICITDHYDYGYPTGEFQLETEAYLARLEEVRRLFADRCRVFAGVEMGLSPDPDAAAYINGYIETQPYDFVIGSVHSMNGTDPYYRDRINAEDEEMYRMYFACVRDCVKACRGFQSLGHLDYVVRYGYRKAEVYRWEEYRDLIDPILEHLTETGTALEVNTAGIRQGLGFPNPHPGILRRYRELGGEMVTVGSDAHRVCDLGYGFETARDILLGAGFRHVTEFREKKPHFIRIDT